MPNKGGRSRSYADRSLTRLRNRARPIGIKEPLVDVDEIRHRAPSIVGDDSAINVTLAFAYRQSCGSW